MRRLVVVLVVLSSCLTLLPVAGADAATVRLGAYRRTGLLPFDGAPLISATSGTTRVDTGVHDSSGVRMAIIGGRIYNHPVEQAQYGLLNLTTYQRTHDAFYLNRAVAQANRLLSRRVASGGAWFFPYPYVWALHNGPDVEHPPWYSALAQGLAIALFCRLYAATHATAWRTYAGYAFAALTHGPSVSAPWTSRVDSNGYLWLEEYPLLPPARSDRTYNGFMYALMGVYEYWQTTRSSTAAALFDGGATTVRDFFGWYRQPNWLSHYCLAHPAPVSVKYHGAHEYLLLSLYTATHRSTFAQDADLLRFDYPPPARGTVHFAAGTHIGYVFSGSGSALATRTMRLASASQAPADARRRIYGRGIYYHVTRGTLAGYWVLEHRPDRYLQGFAAPHVYLPQRIARLAAGTWTGAKFDAAGHSTGSVLVRLPGTATATVSRSAWVNGYPYALVTSGPLAGTWVGMSRALVLT